MVLREAHAQVTARALLQLHDEATHAARQLSSVTGAAIVMRRLGRAPPCASAVYRFAATPEEGARPITEDAFKCLCETHMASLPLMGAAAAAPRTTHANFAPLEEFRECREVVGATPQAKLKKLHAARFAVERELVPREVARWLPGLVTTPVEPLDAARSFAEIQRRSGGTGVTVAGAPMRLRPVADALLPDAGQGGQLVVGKRVSLLVKASERMAGWMEAPCVVDEFHSIRCAAERAAAYVLTNAEWDTRLVVAARPEPLAVELTEFCVAVGGEEVESEELRRWALRIIRPRRRAREVTHIIGEAS